MKKIVVVFAVSFVLLIACSKERRLGEAEPYVQRFESEALKLGKPVKADNLIIEFGDAGKAIATCEQRPLHPPRIILTEQIFRASGDIFREIILFHELTHCLLDRDHVDGLRPDGTPESLMHSRAVTPRVYVASREYYIRELFLRNKVAR